MVNLEIVVLKKDEIINKNSGDTEVGIVILIGKCNVEVGSGEFEWYDLGSRRSVFEKTPDTVYIPCNTKYSIKAVDSLLKIAVISTEAKIKYSPFVVYSDEVLCKVRGEKEWKRNVYDIITIKHTVNSLIIGETIHTDGVWSGYPPHKHDTEDGNNESRNYEVYYVEIEPKDTFAIFLQYGEEWEKTTLLKNGDSICVEEGYHAVVSAGGSKFYYLWALDSKNHRFIYRSDSKYIWLK